MKSHTDKPQENRHDKVSQQQSGAEIAFQFVDNRIETTNLEQLQKAADNNPLGTRSGSAERKVERQFPS